MAAGVRAILLKSFDCYRVLPRFILGSFLIGIELDAAIFPHSGRDPHFWQNHQLQQQPNSN